MRVASPLNAPEREEIFWISIKNNFYFRQEVFNMRLSYLTEFLQFNVNDQKHVRQ